MIHSPSTVCDVLLTNILPFQEFDAVCFYPPPFLGIVVVTFDLFTFDVKMGNVICGMISETEV